MKKKTILLTLVSMFLLSAMVMTSVVAQPRIVGVTIGDWFEYDDIGVSWSSNDPNDKFPQFLEELNETEWLRITVQGVFGTNVTLQTIWHFKNGNDETSGGYIAIDTGNCENVSLLVISANLNVNDTLYTSFYSDVKINETVVRTYPDSVRDANHVNITSEEAGTECFWNETAKDYWCREYYYYESANYYWDKETGIVVEQSGEWINQTGEYLTSWSAWIRITDSGVWIVPEFPTWTSMLLILIVLTVAITISKGRLIKTPIHQQ